MSPACDRCRALKTKCTLIQGTTICSKCNRSCRECRWTQHRPETHGPPKKRQTLDRIVQKLNRLIRLATNIISEQPSHVAVQLSTEANGQADPTTDNSGVAVCHSRPNSKRYPGTYFPTCTTKSHDLGRNSLGQRSLLVWDVLCLHARVDTAKTLLTFQQGPERCSKSMLRQRYDFFIRYTQELLPRVSTLYSLAKRKRIQSVSLHPLMLLDSCIGFMIMLATILGDNFALKHHYGVWQSEMFTYRHALKSTTRLASLTNPYGVNIHINPFSGIVENNQPGSSSMVTEDYFQHLKTMSGCREAMDLRAEEHLTPQLHPLDGGFEVLARFLVFVNKFDG
ncbi:hypothetical protein PV10_07169 [Exophiala mesophila]|uniref:Zn(2)-C6 fungal-type domain-containing protein n=1 Tax=Exophiala mesophila TaxID=212818 RepID=A0A0D1Z790_EXOME|nr:uncharacterized protein PV10_07169 [Exophiala mesophila]KIV89794.1 hypothetical protein PV10_07169 [Exophiala mesophila]